MSGMRKILGSDADNKLSRSKYFLTGGILFVRPASHRRLASDSKPVRRSGCGLVRAQRDSNDAGAIWFKRNCAVLSRQSESDAFVLAPCLGQPRTTEYYRECPADC
jgi:hypothetical protein